jgi:hypothetical protein
MMLTQQERNLVKHLKQRLLALAAIQKSRARQKSILTWLKLGDTNSKFIHLMANVRKKKNCIYSLQTETGTTTLQGKKHSAIFQHFQQHLGFDAPRNCDLNFNNLGWPSRSLLHLDAPVTKEEVHKIILENPKEKAPGPDGFIRIFFAVC